MRSGRRCGKRLVETLLKSLPILPVVAFLTYWALVWDLTPSLVHLRFACYFAPAAPILFVMMARQMTEEKRYREEWAGLEIGECV